MVPGNAWIAQLDELSGRHRGGLAPVRQLGRDHRRPPCFVASPLERARGRACEPRTAARAGVYRVHRTLGFALASEHFSWHIPIVRIADAAARWRRCAPSG
jgi:hypothetical protein